MPMKIEARELTAPDFRFILLKKDKHEECNYLRPQMRWLLLYSHGRWIKTKLAPLSCSLANFWCMYVKKLNGVWA